MTMDTFQYIWKQGIAKAAEDVFEEIPSALREKYSVRMDLSDDMRKKAYEEYEKVRRIVRKRYFDTGKDEENKIDGHKICACITGALLDVRILNFEILEEEMPIKIVYANYEVAFLAAIYVLYLFLLSDFERDGRMDCYEELKRQSTFVFPKTNPGHDSYVQGRIKTLALNDLCGNEFDILNFADMLFWIERYNKEFLYKKLQIDIDY